MTRKVNVNISPSQKIEYAKLMVEENYTYKQIQDISGACSSALVRFVGKDNIKLNYQAINQKNLTLLHLTNN
jgi:transposase